VGLVARGPSLTERKQNHKQNDSLPAMKEQHELV
jgi:hypothetical protein